MPLRDEYNQTFFDIINAGSSKTALAAVPVVVDLFSPTSGIDIGGGSGAWAAELLRAGVADVVTVDGDYVPVESLLVPAETFVAHDLTQPLDLGRRFDLVLSLEVAEHLPEETADTFIDSLTRHGDLVVFSAAIPDQGGTHHINEQWPSYWRALFAARGYELFDVLRPRLWSDSRIAFWFRQNMLVFAAGEAAGYVRALPEVPALIDIVHPELFERRMRMARTPRTIKQSSRDLAAALRRRIRRSLRFPV